MLQSFARLQSLPAPARTLTLPWIPWRWTAVTWMAAEDWTIQRNHPRQMKGCLRWTLPSWTEKRTKSPSRQLGRTYFIISLNLEKTNVTQQRWGLTSCPKAWVILEGSLEILFLLSAGGALFHVPLSKSFCHCLLLTARCFVLGCFMSCLNPGRIVRLLSVRPLFSCHLYVFWVSSLSSSFHDRRCGIKKNLCFPCGILSSEVIYVLETSYLSN